MREYETVCLLQPDLAEARITKLRERVCKILEENKANLLTQKDWGKRKLSYPLGKYSFGYYLYFNFASEEGQFIPELERVLRYEEDVMRFLTVKAAKPSPKAHKVDMPEEANFNLEDARPSYHSDSGGFNRHDREEN